MSAPILHLCPSVVEPQNAVRPQLRVLTSPAGTARPYPPRSSSLTATVGKVMQGAAIQVTCRPSSRPGSQIIIQPAQTYIKHSRSTQSMKTMDKSRCASLSSVRESSSRPLHEGGSLKRSEPLQRKSSNSTAHSAGSLRRRNANRRSSTYSQPSRAGTPEPFRTAQAEPDEDVKVAQPSTSIRSMFPQYQHDIPLSQQEYFPHHVETSHLPAQQISKGLESPPSFAIPFESRLSMGTPSAQEDVVLADNASLIEVWNAANGEQRILPKKLRMAVTCKPAIATAGQRAGTDIRVGSMSGHELYKVTTPPKAIESAEKPSHIVIQRCHPSEGDCFPVAQVDCRSTKQVQDSAENKLAVIFPQFAALSAIRGIANSVQARNIAQFDPDATSPQAAQLAIDAVTVARKREESHIVYNTMQATFSLVHPTIGQFDIQSHLGLNILDSTSRSRGLLSISKPGASPLISMDLADNNLDLDLEAISREKSPYLVDTLVSAIFTVAIAESERTVQRCGLTHFAAPPKTPTKESRKGFKTPTILSSFSSTTSTTKSRFTFGALKTKAEARKAEKEEKKRNRLPPLTRGILHLLGFTFDAIIWLLELGIKILTKLVNCVSGAVQEI